MEFYQFKKDVEAAFIKMMEAGKLFTVNVDNDLLWMGYLLSFPEGDERQSHNCNACKSFIRHMGKAVSIDPVTYEIKTFWDDVHTPGYEKTAADLAKLVKEAAINNIFMQDMNEFHGCDHNIQRLPDGTTRQWNHLYIQLPDVYRFNHRRSNFATLGALKGDVVARRNVFFRSLTELKTDVVETVIDLINDNNLYRGLEFVKGLQEFLKVKQEVENLTNLENYCWLHYDNPIAKIRNTAMGTLLINLSEGMDLEKAVRQYENIMAPANYKRPTAIITKKQIAEAQKKVEELGLTDALARRHAQVEDISINDVLFVNRDTAKKMIGGDVFGALMAEKAINPKEFNKATEVTIEQFLKDVLPGSTNVEVLVENTHISNFVTLTAPINKDAGHLFKWNNNFAWVYNGSVADSFKEKVKAAGGNVDGFMRCSLHWFNFDDLDVHVQEPNGKQIYFGNRRSFYTGGQLDVDMNAGGGTSRDAVENIVWTDRAKLEKGRYTVFVNQFHKRESVDVGFEFEIEINGDLHKFVYDKPVQGNVTVAYIDVTANDITVSPVLPANTSYKSKTEWSIDTMKFQKVSCIMLSPNYWEGNAVGNKHYFFMIDGCKNPDSVRGFFNEYLRADLEKDHRRVFEAIASKAKVEYNENQLSGLGFSTTQRNEIIVKVHNKPFKIKF
jgi:hypothetical protein